MGTINPMYNHLFVNLAFEHHSTIIRDITQINFINLKVLSLSKFMIKTGANKINSLEDLQFINMNCLEDLNLCKHVIYQMQTKL